MNITLYIGIKRIKFYLDCGWYRGGELMLIGLRFLQIVNQGDLSVNLIQLNILLFEFSFGFYEVK